MYSCKKRCDNYAKFYTLCQPTNFTATTSNTKFLPPCDSSYDFSWRPPLPPNFLHHTHRKYPEELKFPTKSFYGPPVERYVGLDGYEGHVGSVGCSSCALREFPLEESYTVNTKSLNSGEDSKSLNSGEDSKNNKGFDKNVWGKHAWQFLHASAWGYPKKPTPEQQSLAKVFYECLPYQLPCQVCGGHCISYIRDHPPNTENRATLTNWLWNFHNSVSERLGKPAFSWEETKAIYEPSDEGGNFCGN